MAAELLSEAEFAGVLRQSLRHPGEYGPVREALAAGGFTVSEWLGVLCVEVKGRLLTASEAYAILAADQPFHGALSRASLDIWR